MPEVKKNHIAVVIGKNGCESIAKVKVVNDQELARLKNELELNNNKKLNEEHKHKKEHQRLFKELDGLKCLLAKSIYDNFVDRGLIENNDDFQKAWFDFFFNDGGKLDFYDTPNEYQKILERLVEEDEE